MEFRTTFSIPPSGFKINYSDPVMFIGSCFASSIGQKFVMGKMPVMINPSGTVYNPVSVCKTISSIISEKKYDNSCIYNNEGTWISFDHYTDFSSDDPEKLIDKLNKVAEEAHNFISTAKYLFITFGTARVYKWINTGDIVSNCHKIASGNFTNELLSVNSIVDLWIEQLDRLKADLPELRVIFTISPIRHLKDGAHGNQVSKSVLFLAVEKLLGHKSSPGYFPAYELIMDDLRDYRFYDEDMLHISDIAVDYIWEAFCNCYLDKQTINLWNEVSKISRAVSHRIQLDSHDQIRKFAENMILKIDTLVTRNPSLDLENEKKYFLDLLRRG